MHISVTEAEIDQALERVLGRSRMGIEGFQAELRKMGMTERQYREMLKEQVLVSKLMNYTVRSKVVVLEDEIKAYYEQQDTKNSGGYYLLQIGFSPTGGGLPTDPEEAKRAVLQKADKVHALAEKGSDFKELARRYSDLPSAIDGGDIGIFQKDEMASYMREAVTSLQPGAVSPVIEVPEGGYMIFKLLSIGRISYESVREEIQDILYKQEMQERYNTWIDEIRNTAYIKIIE